MTPESQRIAIAEACGWTMIYRRGYVATLHDEPFHESAGMVGTPPKHNLIRLLPDYLGDLNVMIDAVRALPNEKQWLCFAKVADIVDPEIPAALATAAQWSEAFLRTLGKWDDTK